MTSWGSWFRRPMGVTRPIWYRRSSLPRCSPGPLIFERVFIGGVFIGGGVYLWGCSLVGVFIEGWLLIDGIVCWEGASCIGLESGLGLRKRSWKLSRHLIGIFYFSPIDLCKLYSSYLSHLLFVLLTYWYSITVLTCNSIV